MFAEICINLPLENTFHYLIPSDLSGTLKIGHLVEVPFGNRRVQGLIIGFDRRSPVPEAKSITGLVDGIPILDGEQLVLARWMSETYLAPLASCVRLFIPPGMSKRGDVLITPVINPAEIAAEGDTQARLLRLLSRRGPLRGRQVERSLPRRNWEKAVKDLMERGLLLREPVLDPPSIRPKTARFAELSIRPAQIDTFISDKLDPANLPTTRQAAAERRAAILRLLSEFHHPLTVGQIYASVPGSSLTDLRHLANEDVVTLRDTEVLRDSLAERSFVPDTPPVLTPDQARAWATISKAIHEKDPQRPFLLHGVTGSGKTEIYLQAVQQTIDQGRSAIIMVPEIALTPQTVRRFGARFQGRIGLIHSALSEGERFDTWRRAREGQFDVIIGPRSALFTPLRDLGLIVLDECHDDSYKQTPPIEPPYYHAVPAAEELGRLKKAVVILGSATPNVTTYSLAQDGHYELLELPARIMGHRRAIELQAVHYRIAQTRYHEIPDSSDEAVMIELPPVQIVDMRQELRAGNRSIFSRALTEGVHQTLKRGEQTILFLNRRGTATYVFCRDCGHVLLCPNCEIPLTWHRYRNEASILVCHHCNHRTAEPKHCPNCNSDQIKYFGGGTERVEEEIKRNFPEAVPVRWDRDTTGGKDTHEQLLEQFINRQANILIGTQMVAKGLDLPLVTLVGVVSADTALNLPDYRSGERTFQLLTQVGGRAGRGLLGGQVILQTYSPEHYAIQTAAEHDYYTFYKKERSYRASMGYPPFTRLIRLLVRHENLDTVKEHALKLHEQISRLIRDRNLKETSLIGPAPCFYPRLEGQYRWHVILRGPAPHMLIGAIKPVKWLQVDVDPVSLL